jgi:hypothetical protein
METKRQILRCISHWWNDTLRKVWRTALEDPEEREKLFNELANEIYEQVYQNAENGKKKEEAEHDKETQH